MRLGELTSGAPGAFPSDEIGWCWTVLLSSY